MRKALLALAGVLGVTLSTVALAARYEEPPYTVVEERDDLEVRRYGPTIQAQTVMSSESDPSLNGGFRVLADYIFGGNEEEQSIAMTTPVTTQPVQDTLVMTFTMPAEFDMDSLPEPNDPRVTLVQVPGGDFAVLTFSGRVKRGDYADARARLLQRVEEEGLQTIGEPIVAQYNGPWTPGPLRRNEVMIQLAP